ncbi:hypothetical protein N658DRAFT_489072 [Parathielavia hyrcaniae]|uniref:NWD NACHT-NTPase N-terminal domain-containing protein n=1 Tax=Parathielavia hyrcaniae TaxID=113614 RepID=A0AAN6PTF7_9PEZI|nr:hypothetical protein N658DRAFT_489072 [Parathielavia hyrcaniae]
MVENVVPPEGLPRYHEDAGPVGEMYSQESSFDLPTMAKSHGKSEGASTDSKKPGLSVTTVQILPTNARSSTTYVQPVISEGDLGQAAAAYRAPGTESTDGEQGAISRHLWNVAYENLRAAHETAKLMETYEKILTNMHLQRNESDTLRLSDDAPNMLDCDSKQRVARMTDMTRLSLEKAKRHENVHMAVKQVIDFVRATSNVVSVTVAVYPPASIAWLGICAILPILAMPSTQSLALRDGLLYVMEKMEWYTTLSRQSLKTPPSASSDMWSLAELVRGRVTQLLQALLEYEAKAVCFLHGKGPLTRAISSIFSVQWDTALEDVRSLETEIGGYLARFEITVTSVTLGQISQDTASLSHLLREMRSLRQGGDEDRQKQAAARRLELVARFSTEKTCPYLDRMMAVARRVEGTCEWIQAHPKYHNWLASPSGGLLLLSADPGCGKSVLSRLLVEEVLPAKASPETTTLCYFFFGGSPDQNNAPAALCALIHQMLSKRPEMTDLVRNEIIQNGSALTIKPLVLWQILEKLVWAHEGNEIVCVFDALDECQRGDRLWLVERLQTLFETNSSVADFRIGPRRSAAETKLKGMVKLQARPQKIKLLVTTRGYPEILKLFANFSRGCVHLAGESKEEVDQIQNEIATVVDYRLDRLGAERGFSDARKEVLRRSFQHKGGQQRTYLWVRLVFEVLESNLRDQLRVWQGIINTLPQTVYDAYDKLLDKVRDGDRDRVMLLLRLMTAAFRPLPVHTAILLLNAREFADDEGLDGDDDDDAGEERCGEALEWESEKSFRAWVLETCGCFVTIYDQQLFFIHQTAKEFLQESRQPFASVPIPRQPQMASHNHGSTTFRHSIFDKEAHKAMAEACIALWKYGEKPTENWRWAGDERYRYPLELWAQHFREAQVFARKDDDSGNDGGVRLVSDVDDRFWSTYLALWRDTAFIRGQRLGQFLAKYNMDVYEAPAYTDDVRLAFVATYGHYRLLDMELRRLSGTAISLDMMPYLLSAEGPAKECATLLLRHLPMRPVVVVSEYS